MCPTRNQNNEKMEEEEIGCELPPGMAADSPPSETPTTRNKISDDGAWVSIKVGSTKSGRNKYGWAKMSECIKSGRGHYFLAETHARWSDDGLVYRKTKMTEISGSWFPNDHLQLLHDGTFNKPSNCYILKNGNYALTADVLQTVAGDYHLAVECVEIDGSWWHKETDVVTLYDGTDYVKRYCAKLGDGEWYKKNEIHEVYIPDDDTWLNVHEDDCVMIGDNWYHVDNTVVLQDGNSYPKDASCEIDGLWYKREDCLGIHGVWHKKEDCINIEGAWHSRVAMEGSSDILVNGRAFVLSDYRQIDDIWYYKDNCVDTISHGFRPIAECCQIDEQWHMQAFCYLLSDNDKWVLRNNNDAFWHIPHERIRVSVGADGYEWSEHYDCYIRTAGSRFTWSDDLDRYSVSEHLRTCDYCNRQYDGETQRRCCSSSRNRPDRINGYHHSPKPSIYMADDELWGIGFEVEKSSVDGQSCSESQILTQPLFAGWETDSSCGVEGVTHVYGMQKHFDTFKRHLTRSFYVDESANSSCGGHVNISRKSGLTLADVRPYCGLLYSMYRDRLNISYASNNKRMIEANARTDYATVRAKSSTLLEFRLVGKVNDSNDLLWRFQLFQQLIEAVERQWSFEYYLRKSRPVLKGYYNSKLKLDGVYPMAHKFQDYLSNGIVHDDIVSYI